MQTMGPLGVVFTIGHSTHTLDRLLELLRQHGITRVADVRSVPYSQRQPHFNREVLAHSLDEAGIAYEFLGKELGARSDDQACYEDGRVQYRKLASTAIFRQGIERVRADARSGRVVVLCAEMEPLDCHRTLLVARELEALGTPVAHIHADGGLETHKDTIHRLLDKLKMPRTELFRGEDEIVDEAYARQERHIAYSSDKRRPTYDAELE